MPDMLLRKFIKWVINRKILLIFQSFCNLMYTYNYPNKFRWVFASLLIHIMLIQPVLGMCNARHGFEKCQ